MYMKSWKRGNVGRIISDEALTSGPLGKPPRERAIQEILELVPSGVSILAEDTEKDNSLVGTRISFCYDRYDDKSTNDNTPEEINQLFDQLTGKEVIEGLGLSKEQRKVFKLHSLGVNTEYRGRGIATKLLEFSLEVRYRRYYHF